MVVGVGQAHCSKGSLTALHCMAGAACGGVVGGGTWEAWAAGKACRQCSGAGGVVTQGGWELLQLLQAVGCTSPEPQSAAPCSVNSRHAQAAPGFHVLSFSSLLAWQAFK